ncbi:MAG: hypothetical protein GJT30_00460 [Geobacter sp.]|nr:hypothetical protein [Geobacter sp.]
MTFKINSGPGSFSAISQVSTTTATITNGVATAQLTSDTAGTTEIYATYGTTNSTTKTVRFTAQTVSLTASSPAAMNSDPITLTATVSPAVADGSLVTFSVVSGGAIASIGGATSQNVPTSNSQATAVLTPSGASTGTVVVRATYGTVNSSDVSVQFASITSPVMVLTASKSYLVTAADPILVVASFYPSLSSGTLINMNAAGGAGVIKVEGGTYGTSATPGVIASGALAGKAYVYLKSSDSTTTGNATVTASYGIYPTTSAIVSFLPEIGTSTKSVSLTASALTKIAGRNVTDIRFNIVNDAVSNSACYYKSITPVALLGTLIPNYQQSDANSTVVSFADLSGTGVALGSTAPVKLLDIEYGYNPVMASLSIVPVSMTVAGGASVTLTAADFLIQ